METTIYEQLKLRFNRMSDLSRKICSQEISKDLRLKFYDVVGMGIKLNEKIIVSKDWNSQVKYEISKYLLLCEECLDDVGIELPKLHCKMRSEKVIFSNERLLITSFLYGKLNDSMFN